LLTFRLFKIHRKGKMSIIPFIFYFFSFFLSLSSLSTSCCFLLLGSSSPMTPASSAPSLHHRVAEELCFKASPRLGVQAVKDLGRRGRLTKHAYGVRLDEVGVRASPRRLGLTLHSRESRNGRCLAPIFPARKESR